MINGHLSMPKISQNRGIRKKSVKPSLFYFQAVLALNFKILKVEKHNDDLHISLQRALKGKYLWEIFKDFDSKGLSKQMKALLLNEGTQELIIPIPLKKQSLKAQFTLVDNQLMCHVVFHQDAKKEKPGFNALNFQFNALLNNTDESIVYIDKQFHILNFNAQAADKVEENTGLKLVIGKNLKNIIPGGMRKKYLIALNKCFKGEKITVNFDLPTLKGQMWIETKMNPVLDAAGKVIGAVLLLKNIQPLINAEKEIIKAKEKLDQNESILRAFLINSNDAIAIIDLEFKIVALNETMKVFTKRLYGKAMEIGEDYLVYVPEELKGSLFSDYKEVLKGQTMVKDLYVKVGQQSLWFQFKVAAVYDTKKTLVGLALTAQNIDDQKRAELVLQKNEEKFKKIIEQAAMPMVLVNSKGKINIANIEAEKLLGYQSNELFDKNIGVLFHQHKIKSIKETNFTEDLADGIKRMYNSKNKVIYVDMHVRKMNFDEQPFTIVSFKDISEQIQTQNQLEKINHELQLLTKMNDLILKAESRELLFSRLCKCIVVDGKYKLAWISILDESTPHFIEPQVSYGETDYLKGFKISLKSNKHLRGPSARAFMSGEIMVTNNVNASDDFKPWLKKAKTYGIAASCVIPIVAKNKVIGLLNIYSAHSKAFDKNEVSVLSRLGKNLSLAIHNIETNQQKNNTLIQLSERMKELRTIYLINKMLKDDDVSFEDLIKAATDIIPGGWKYAEHCQVKIEFDNTVYHSNNFQAQTDKLFAGGKTHDGKNISLEVSYQKKFEDEFEGPFLKEEIDLINALLELFIMNYNKYSIYKSLAQSEANLKSIINNTNVGHLLLDKDYRILLFSESLGDIYTLMSGKKMQLNHSIFEYVSPNLKGTVDQIFEEVVKTKEPFVYEFDVNTVYGKQYLTSTVVPVFDFQEQNSFSVSVYDITKIKSLEVEREKMISDLMQRNRDLEQFSYIISHNIRSPLATLLGFSALLKNNVSDDDKAIILQGMQDSASKLDNTIKDVNEILNIKKELSQSKTEINLEELMITVLETLEQNIKSSGAIVTHDFSKASKLYSINPYIHSIFFNLIGNAIKYAKRNTAPQIHIWTELENSNIIIQFKDNGMGIDLKKHGVHLFGLYKKFNFEIEGKGMGLFMVKTQIQALGGSIDVVSQPEEGSTFTVKLPLF